jgi:hypothetical protein
MPLQILQNWPHAQLNIIRRDPPRLVLCEQLGGHPPGSVLTYTVLIKSLLHPSRIYTPTKLPWSRLD